MDKAPHLLVLGWPSSGSQGELPPHSTHFPGYAHKREKSTVEKNVNPGSEDLYSSPVPTTDCVTLMDLNYPKLFWYNKTGDFPSHRAVRTQRMYTCREGLCQPKARQPPLRVMNPPRPLPSAQDRCSAIARISNQKPHFLSNSAGLHFSAFPLKLFPNFLCEQNYCSVAIQDVSYFCLHPIPFFLYNPTPDFPMT